MKQIVIKLREKKKIDGIKAGNIKTKTYALCEDRGEKDVFVNNRFNDVNLQYTTR